MTQIDWSAIDNDEEAEVCLFRIASSYKSPEVMKKWLELGEWENVKVTNDSSNIFTWSSKGVGANWDLKNKGVHYAPNVLIGLWIKTVAYRFDVGLAYDKDNHVQNVSCNYSIL